MADASLLKKLGIKAGLKFLLLNVPDGYRQALLRLGHDSASNLGAEGSFDFVQAFVRAKADVDRLAPEARRALKPGGLLWLTYPKKGSAVKTDISRDIGWDDMYAARWRPVSLVAIDGTWSALRFRPVKDVKSRK